MRPIRALIALAFVAPSAAATAQVEVPPSRAPCSVLDDYPCHPSFCSVFETGPCFPQYLPPIGQDLRLTIVARDENAADGGAGKQSGDRNPVDGQGDDHALDTIAALYAALRGCYVPPPKDAARHGMEYTIRFAFKRDGGVIAPPRVTYATHDAPAAVREVYREAVDAALARCTPMHFTKGMGGAVAGRPIAIRFVDERTSATEPGK